jgi:hypothetical protein
VRIELEARRPRELAPLLLLAWGAGGSIAFISLWVAIGSAGMEAMEGGPRAAMLLIAALALLPALWLSVRCALLRRPSRLVIGRDGLTIHYPRILRDPMMVPLGAVRAAVVDDTEAVDDAPSHRFRVHATSGPYHGSADDVWLWGGGSPLPALTRPGRPPNVALVFEEPVAAPRLRREQVDGPMRGERIAGLLLAARDASAAERALDGVLPLRPLTMPDLFRLKENLGPAGAPAASGGRLPLLRRHLHRWGWAMVAGAVVLPLLALGALANAIGLWRLGGRGHALAMGAVAVAVGAASVLVRLA